MKKSTFILMIIFHSLVFAQDGNKTRAYSLGATSFLQLSSTKTGFVLTLNYHRKKNNFYLGPKIQISNSNIYYKNFIGIVAGDAFNLISHNKLNFYITPDIQWLNLKTRNQDKPTHYFDFTLNYQLNYSISKRISVNSSFGYGIFLKHFYIKSIEEWDDSIGLSGLIRVGVSYLFKL